LNLEEKSHEKMLKIAFQREQILTFSGGACPQTPLEAHTFGARDTCLVCSESLATVLLLKL